MRAVRFRNLIPAFFCAVALLAQRGGGAAANLGSLKRVAVPQVPGLDAFVADPKALVVLGKALFWDMQAGSDGRTACATCHFHAGADHRITNQLSNSAQAFPANRTFSAADFPFHVVADIATNNSAVLRDSNSVAGSAGVYRRGFLDIAAGPADLGNDLADAPAFTASGVNVRQVTGRNSPSVINTVFNYRNFWDGRARNAFTGRTPFGDSDKGANILAYRNGQMGFETIRLTNASLASQAVGPALNGVEMSYVGRTWSKFGRKMLALPPLALQRVAGTDGVLGPVANSTGSGLTPGLTYLALVQAAFRPEFWNSPLPADGDFSQAEFNFSVFWGLAIQAYESTLVSDDTSFDRFQEGTTAALTADQQNGLRVFLNSECNTCHSGAELTAASVANVLRNGTVQRNGPAQIGVDTGFFRTGVRPASDDIGLGAVDDFNLPLAGNSQTLSRGAFKTPGLRNVEFSGPYFHDGSQASLEQVVDFYMRGGDFPAGALGPDIQRRNVNAADRRSLVNFMLSLTDDRVRYEKAPFDHPELCVPHGTDTSGIALADGIPVSGTDRMSGLPPTGAEGNKVPLQTFVELLIGVGTDGSRAHSLTEACTVPLP